MPAYQQLDISVLVEPQLPVRATMDEQALDDLTESIRRMGLLQPLIVVPSNGLFEVVAGHRRYHACRRAGLSPVPCMIYQDPELAREAAKLHENIYREDLTAAEEALFFAELIEKGQHTEEQLCALVRQNPEYIYARLDLLKGDQAVLQANADRKITFSVAKELNKVSDEPHRRYLLDCACKSGASAKTVAQWVHDWRKSKIPPPAPAASQPNPEGPAAPAGPSTWCEVCGINEDPQNLVLVSVHKWELEQFRRVVTTLREPQPR